MVNESKGFSSTNTKRKYKIRNKVDCNSSFVIYLVTCSKCGGQYVGKSQSKFKLRHSNHKQEIKVRKGGLGRHFHVNSSKGCTYKDLSVTIIEKVEEGNKQKLKERELFWQYQLRGFEENGGGAMNIKDDL